MGWPSISAPGLRRSQFEKGEIADPVGATRSYGPPSTCAGPASSTLSEQVLSRALPTYLTDRPDVPQTNQSIDGGLSWATAKINETVALLGQVFTGSNGPIFEGLRLLIDHLIRTSTPVPDPMWTLALEQAGSAEWMVIGVAACPSRQAGHGRNRVASRSR